MFQPLLAAELTMTRAAGVQAKHQNGKERFNLIDLGPCIVVNARQVSILETVDLLGF